MKNGKLIALSAVSTALGVVFLIIGAYFQTLDLSCLFMASLTVMLPLSKNSVKGAFLTYGATSILAFIFAVNRFHLSLLYLLFFGLHPIINYFHLKYGKKAWFLYLVKGALFLTACYLMVYAFTMFIVTNEIINQILPVFVFVVGTLFFIAYDLVMIRFQNKSSAIIKRLGL